MQLLLPEEFGPKNSVIGLMSKDALSLIPLKFVILSFEIDISDLALLVRRTSRLTLAILPDIFGWQAGNGTTAPNFNVWLQMPWKSNTAN